MKNIVTKINSLDFKGFSFLIVEDNEINQEILKELLELKGGICKCVSNGKEACKVFLDSTPTEYDLILLDIYIPLMNGYEVAKAIRKSSHVKAHTIPIIAISGDMVKIDSTDIKECKINAYLKKPINNNNLFKMIKEELWKLK